MNHCLCLENSSKCQSVYSEIILIESVFIQGQGQGHIGNFMLLDIPTPLFEVLAWNFAI